MAGKNNPLYAEELFDTVFRLYVYWVPEAIPIYFNRNVPTEGHANARVPNGFLGTFYVTLVGKILTVAIFLMSILFLGFTVMTYATQRDYRTLVRGGDGVEGLETQLRATQNKVREREEQIRRTKQSISLETASRRKALSVLELRARQLVAQLETARAEYEQLANEQRRLNENVQSVQEEVARLKVQVDQERTALMAAIGNRNEQLDKVADLTDRIHQGEGMLRRLRERNRQFSDLRSDF